MEINLKLNTSRVRMWVLKESNAFNALLAVNHTPSQFLLLLCISNRFIICLLWVSLSIQFEYGFRDQQKSIKSTTLQFRLCHKCSDVAWIIQAREELVAHYHHQNLFFVFNSNYHLLRMSTTKTANMLNTHSVLNALTKNDVREKKHQ